MGGKDEFVKRSLKALDAEVTAALNFLEGIGYRYEQANESSMELLGPYIECCFRNAMLGTSLTLNLIPAEKPGTRNALVLHMGWGNRTLTLHEYLKYYGATEARSRALELGGASEPAVQDIARVLAAASELLRGELFGVISGKEWKDVPIDWGDYK